ncbi:MAG: Mur ligase domain-containing protein, partial [Holosporales bacterium]|nr:Mur ligase domain-containing protein [Holosporales bacterium]
MAFFTFLQEQIPAFIPPKQEEPRHLASDSRQVQKGSVFAALPGIRQTRSPYLPQALAAGASWIVLAPEDYAQFTGRTPPSPPAVVPSPEAQFILVENPRQFWAQLVAAFYAKQPEACVAVTGTNGKSSVVDFTRQIWTLLGKKSASIGTLGIRFGF